MDGCTITSTSPSVKNQVIGRISDKRKISGVWKIKTQLATARAAAAIPVGLLSVSLLCFLHDIVFGTQTLWIRVFLCLARNVWYWLRKTPEELLQLHRLEIWLWELLDKHRADLKLLPPQVCEMCFVIYISRAEQVIRECDIHPRSIKTNSAVNLSRKPGLDLCSDLLKHLQGLIRTF